MNLTKEQRIAKHKQFLNANWQLLAAFAWEHYQQQGRGAVAVDENDFVHAEIPQYAAIKLRYVSDSSPVLRDIGGWPGDKEAKLQGRQHFVEWVNLKQEPSGLESPSRIGGPMR